MPEAVVSIAKRLIDRGYETWTVGGAIRDAQLGGSRSDWDLATAARPETVRKLFRPSYPIGIQFGTVGVRGDDGRIYEVTTFRRDLETDGRHAVVEYAEELDEDLARRDFTINAIAYHPLRHVYHDPYSGRGDLRRGVLRCVGDPAQRFAEDYLRVLRGLRFAGRYGLQVESATWEALKATVPLLPRLSAERVREELLKVMAAPQASPALALYRESGALAILLPELAGLTAGAWDELLETIDLLSPKRPHLRMTALLAPAGDQIELIMTRLRFSNAELRGVLALAAALALELPSERDDVAGRRWLHRTSGTSLGDALRLQFARARGRRADRAAQRRLASQARQLRNLARRGDPVALADLAIDGNDLKALGLPPGPAYAAILASCLEAVLVEPDLNQRDKLLEMVRRQL